MCLICRVLCYENEHSNVSASCWIGEWELRPKFKIKDQWDNNELSNTAWANLVTQLPNGINPL